MKKLTLLCFLSFFFFSSCKKEKSDKWTTVNIHSVNPHTSEAVDQIYFAMRGYRSSWPDKFDYHGNFYPVDGHLSYSFKAKNNFDYTLYHPSSDYYNIAEKHPQIKIGETNDFTVPLVKYGHLQVFIENLDCVWDDSLNWKITYIDDPTLNISNRYWTVTWDGCYGVETPINKAVPSGYYHFEWKLKEVSGESSAGEQILWVPENETFILDFKY